LRADVVAKATTDKTTAIVPKAKSMTRA
jgi:hypothetical protein